MPHLKASHVTCFLATLILSISVSLLSYSPCVKKSFGHGSIVCVCNATYCDQFLEDIKLESGQYVVYTSTKDGQRFNESLHTIHYKRGTDQADLKLVINTSVRYQTIFGFGGAFTDAATLNIFNLTVPLQQKVFEAYYSKSGIGYTIGRVPMASCDFSTHVYSYDDVEGDFQLKNFKLTVEDLKYKIPAIKRAKDTLEKDLRLFASPWSSPWWMKTNKKMQHPGKLIGNVSGKYYKTWANYFVKFLQEYEKNGVNFWGLTVENEPNAGSGPSYAFQCLGFTAELERDFVKKDLGPALHNSDFKNVSLMIIDDQRLFVSYWAQIILGDPDAKKYISGIGVHWYMDKWIPPSFLDDAHSAFPDVFILSTEACAGFGADGKGVLLGSWDRGEEYGHFIMQDLNHWSVGWTDWNLVLNMEGGPNWVKNFVDSPIIADFENKVFYKQPTFYHMGHFSRFVEPGSVRISATFNQKTSLECIAFITPSNAHVLIVLNREEVSVTIQISEEGISNFIHVIPPRSIQTFKWT